MKIVIQETMFDTLLKGVAKSVAADDYRRELKFIKIVVKKDSLAAYSCSGYTAARVIYDLESNEAEFTCYIKPIPFKASKSGANSVTIELTEGVASVEVPTEYGTLRYSFDQPKEWSVDIEKVFTDAKQHDREVGVNAVYVARALKMLASTSLDRNKLAIIESKDSKTGAFCIRASRKGFACDQLILPVRIDEEG